jgi:very-short-patch-repair endonuclease
VYTGVQESERIARLERHTSVQHGVFTLAQALSSGYSRATVRRRVQSGQWQEIAPRVYRAAVGAPPDWRTRTMARVLAVDGAACRCSALALHGLRDAPGEPEVVVVRPRRTATRAPAPSTDTLPACDLMAVDRVPVTTPARTLIDVAGRLPRVVFEDLLDTAIVRQLASVTLLRTRAQALWAPRRNGCAIVLELLDARDPGLRDARNVWEAKVLREVRALGLPVPRVNHRVRVGGRVRYLDVAWPEVKVAIEFDGFVPHSTRRVFDDDRVRQNDLVADGWTVFRVTAPMLRDPARTFGPIAAAITAKGSDLFRI